MSIEEKDEIQYKKAQIKISAVNAAIPNLILLNNELGPKESKAYTITLDYLNLDSYYKFIVDIKRTYTMDAESLLKIYFSLKDLNAGLSLFDQVRDCYVENNEMVYVGFSSREGSGIIESFDASGINKINLKYVIHSDEELNSLTTFRDNLYKNAPEKMKVKQLSSIVNQQ